MAKTMFVRLAPEFVGAICTDSDPDHPFGPDVLIVGPKGKEKEAPVYEVSANAYIKDKIREGILEEVRDFDGVPRNDPDHPNHVDNAGKDGADGDSAVLAQLASIAQPSGYTDEDVQGIVAKALEAQAQKSQAGQQKAIDDAVAKALLAQKTPAT